jgi:hypothetical protein
VFPKSTCYFSLWLFCQVGLTRLPSLLCENAEIHTAQLSSPSWHVRIPKWPTPHWQGNNLPNFLAHFTLSTTWMRFKTAHKLFSFTICPNFYPKLEQSHIFFPHLNPKRQITKRGHWQRMILNAVPFVARSCQSMSCGGYASALAIHDL